MELNMAERREVINAIEPHLQDTFDTYLKSPAKLWQPADFIPDPAEEGFMDKLADFRERAKAIPDDVMVVLIGDMITEEALPSYQNWMNQLEGIEDKEGVGQSNWARWSRGWTAEENRHGDLLNQYLLLSGRANMRSVQQTIHSLINNGFNPKTENDPYQGFIYTSFQERATFISHKNTARLAMEAGDENLQRMCSAIAGDERRHEHAYKQFISKVFELDQDNAMLAFFDMMKKKITMPAALMDDGHGNPLFDAFSVVGQATGIYTTFDYASIIEDLLQTWDIANRKNLSSAAQAAQEYLCKLPKRFYRLAERVRLPNGAIKLPWIWDREILISNG